MTKSREWLLYNAVAAWTSNYADMKGPLTDQYIELQEELRQVYEQSINPQTRKRGRAAKRQRTKKATGNPASTETSKTTNQET